MGDVMVMVNGRLMTMSQYRALVDKAVSGYTQQMTVAIEQLSGLRDQMYVHSGDVSMALYALQSDMSGIERAIGTDDQGQKFRSSWNGAWKQLQDGFKALATALIQVGDSLGTAADTVYQAEEKTLEGFDTMGFHFRAGDPRQRTRPGRPPRGAF